MSNAIITSRDCPPHLKMKSKYLIAAFVSLLFLLLLLLSYIPYDHASVRRTPSPVERQAAWLLDTEPWKWRERNINKLNPVDRCFPTPEWLNMAVGAEDQYARFVRKRTEAQLRTREPIFPDADHYARLRTSYTFDVRIQRAYAACPPGGPWVLTLQIQETCVVCSAFGGGTAFRSTAYSLYVEVCGFRDYFNGTYDVYCPIHGKFGQVLIKLADVAFAVYMGTSYSFKDTIVYFDAVAVNRSIVSVLSTAVGKDGRWRYYPKSQWKREYMLDNGLVFPHDKDRCQCTRK